MAQVLALHLNPGWAAGAALQMEPQEGARLPGLTNPSLGTLGTGGFHSVGWREAKSPTVPTRGTPRSAVKISPAPAPPPTVRALTWAAGTAIVLQREAGKAGTVVGAHGVDAQVLAQLPREEQALILVVTGQAVGQLSLRAQ